MKEQLIASSLALCLLLSLSACAAPASSTALTPSPTASSIVVETPVITPTEPEEENIVQGTITDATMNGVSIRTADGQDLFFPTVDAEVTTVNGLVNGNWISVEYRGAINGVDTAGVHVDRIIDNAPNLKEAADAIVMEEVDETLYASHALHVRTTNSTDGQIIATLSKGTEINCTGRGPHGWYRINYQGNTAYVFGDYWVKNKPVEPIAETTVPTDTLTAVDETVSATVNLRIHANPSLDGAQVSTLPEGAKARRVGTFSNGWSKIIYNGIDGYADSEYLTAVVAEAVDVDATPAGVVNRSPANTTYYATVALKLHKTYSSNSSVVAVVPKGTPLFTINLMDNHWSEVEYDNQTLYCVTQYLSQEQTATAQNVSTEENFTPTNNTVYALNALHVRLQPSLGGQLLGTVTKGTEMLSTGVSADGAWTQVSFEGSTGYCSSQYLTGIPSPMNGDNPVLSETDEIVTTTADLRLHDNDAVEAPVIATVPAGTQMRRVGLLSDGWSVVYYNGQRLFCASDYLA